MKILVTFTLMVVLHVKRVEFEVCFYTIPLVIVEKHFLAVVMLSVVAAY